MLFLTQTEAVLSLGKPTAEGEEGLATSTGSEGVQPQDTTALRMSLVGANEDSRVVGEDELPGKSNYFIGNDPAEWRLRLPNFSRVRYQEIYDGIDLVYYGSDQRRLEYDFVVSPGADPLSIRLRFEGVESVTLNQGGDLFLRTASGEVIQQQAPVVYQEIGGDRRIVDGGYDLVEKNEVGFRIAAYDGTRNIVIDPVLTYSTYLGGGRGPQEGGGELGYSVAVDGSKNMYVTGTTSSLNFPTSNPAQAEKAGGSDAFVTKLNAAGSAFIYSTYLGGSNFENGVGIAVDGSGNAYVTGHTGSPNFPTANPMQSALLGTSDAFVAKLDAEGSAFVYSTYLGGSNSDAALGIAVDQPGYAYVTGSTASPDFPTANPMQSALLGSFDAFVAKLNPMGHSFVYSTYLGGSIGENGRGITIDTSGNVYVTGNTSSPDFPTANPIQPALLGTSDAFVAKLDAGGSAFVYSTYLGGSNQEDAYGIAVDRSGHALVTGYTTSPNFPTAKPKQAALSGNSDAFVTKLNPAGDSFVYSTYLGGSKDESGQGVSLDGSENAYVAGATTSFDFPTAKPRQSTYGGGTADAFVTKLDAAGNAFIYSTYHGGNGHDAALSIAVDGSGDAYLAGLTSSTNFPTRNPIQAARVGYYDAFVSKFSLCGDAIIDPGEQCDDGELNGTTESCCKPTCAFEPSDTTCDDGNSCTQTDTCQAGTCSGANPIVCAASDQCHLAGTCDPGSGLCSNPEAPEGTACSDGNACTRTDACQSGTCSGTNPVVCSATDQCHVAGVCNPGTGACSDPAAPVATACEDGDSCTGPDTCNGQGQCMPGPLVFLGKIGDVDAAKKCAESKLP